MQRRSAAAAEATAPATRATSFQGLWEGRRGLGLRVWGLGFRVWGLGFGV